MMMKSYVANNKDEFIIPTDELIRMCAEVRFKLEKMGYDTKSPSSKHYKYRGLSDMASEMIIEKVNEYSDAHCDGIVDAELMHGEQKHEFGRNPQTWFYEQTWVKLYDGKNTMYVDATMSQFVDMYKDRYSLPSAYVSKYIPPIYLPDKYHPYFKTKNEFRRKLYKLWIDYVIYPIGEIWYKISPKIVVNI